MDNNTTLSLLLIVLSLISHGLSLTCLSCESRACQVVTECKAGMVMDVCNCCPICAQADGQRCGGTFEIEGKCGMELYCKQPYHNGDDLMSSSQIGNCTACEQVIHTGCNVIQGVCQCGDSCTHSFEFSDRDTCLNSVKAQGSMSDCDGKLCIQTELDTACPEDSVRPEKKLSLDGCCEMNQACECIDQSCPPIPTCTAGKRLAELSRGDGTPGSCCSQYTCVNATAFRCEIGNSTFTDGQTVNLENCRECRCKDGIVLCNPVQCDNPSCEWLSFTEGQCCPVCKGCVSAVNAERYSNGETWEEDNSCVQCQCVDGQTHCTASACERRCQNPRKVPGLCCPICDDEDDIYEPYSTTTPPSLMCPDSTDCPTNCRRKIMVEINGCSVCFCEDDINMCPGSSDCAKVCTHGYKKDHELGCSECRCNKCAPFSCNLSCRDGYNKDHNGCNLCECKGTEPTSLAPIGVCFTAEGRTYASGDSWFDGCRECYCENGRELCSLISCPPLSCAQPVVKSADCCPSCPSDIHTAQALNITTSCVAADGSQYSNKQVWQLDTCTVCACHAGQALCETERCPPALCSNPVKHEGKCCAECSEKKESHTYKATGKPCSTATGVTFDHGNIWKVSDCQSCMCQSGMVSCFSQVCPILQCKTTVQQKGQCCPKCTAQSVYDKVCIYEGNWYKHLESWSDENLQCLCIHGNAQCESVKCTTCDDNSNTREDSSNQEQTIPLSVGLPTIIIFSLLLLTFAIIIVVLLVYIMRQRKKRRSNVPAITKQLEHKALNRDASLNKKRPKSTNLEFLHATNDNRYNTAIIRGDADCFRPLVDENNHANEYVHC